MAMTIRNAVAPFAAMLVSTSAVGPIETNSTRPIAALEQEKARHQ